MCCEKVSVSIQLIIVSKDSDFIEKAFIRGFPPKIIWINRGNCSTDTFRDLIKRNFQRIKNFSEDEYNALLILA